MLPRGPIPLTAGFEQELAYIAYDDEGDEIYEEAQVRAELRGRDKAQSWVGKQVRNTGGSPPAKRVKGGPMPPDYLLQREPWQVLPRGPLPLTAVFEQELAIIGRFMLPVEATCLREIKVDELAPPHVPRGVPKDWLRVRLDNNRTIYPRIDNTDASKWETSYHGTRWLQALNVLKQRRFDFGYRCTAKKSGVWHAAMLTAVKYALPFKWTGCDIHTQAVFEISISRKTKHGHGPAFCTQDPRCYQVEAILLGRYEGPASLKGFHRMDLGEEFNAEAVMSCIR